MRQRTGRFARVAWRGARRLLPGPDDALTFGGLGAIGAGVWAIYPPAAAIVVGLGLIALGLAEGQARAAERLEQRHRQGSR